MARELFKLIGLIGTDGVEKTTKQLKAIDRQVRKTQKSFDKIGNSAIKFGKNLTKGVTTPLLAFAAVAVKGTKDASDLNEVIAKTGEIFGSSSKEIEAWAGNSDKALGQSKVQAMEAASNFAIFGKSAGLTGKKLTSFSTDFVKLASDMASFNNTSPEQAITAVGAALRGENEPIRKYGVLLNDATMRQKALELGIISNIKKALSPQNKILAAQSLIYEQTTSAQGDFARTSEGLANKTRILEAQFKNLSAEFGSIFLPIALDIADVFQTKILPSLQSMVKWFKELSPEMKKTIGQWILLAVAIGPVIMMVGQIVKWMKILIPLYTLITTKQLTLNAVMTANPIGALIVAIGLLVAAGIYLANNWETVSAVLTSVWNNLQLIVNKSVSRIIGEYARLLSSFLGTIEKMATVIPSLGKQVSKLRKELEETAKTEAKNRVMMQERHDNTVKAIAIQNKYNDTLKKSKKAAKELYKEELKANESKKVISEEQKKLNEKKAQFEKQWSDKLKKQSANRLQTLKIEYLATVQEAQKSKASLVEVDKWYANEKATIEAEILQQKTDFENQWYEKLLQAKDAKFELLALEHEEALMLAEQQGASLAAIDEFYKIQKDKLDEDLAKKEAARDKKLTNSKVQNAKSWLSNVSGFMNQLGSIANDFQQNELARIDQKQQADIDRINNSVMSETAKADAINTIEDKAAQETLEIKRKQAKQEKALSIFSIAINTAGAIMKAWVDVGFPGAIPLTALIAGLGIAQTIAVAAKPVPFEKGGLVKSSPGKGIFANIGEGKEDELVFPLKTGLESFFNMFMAKIGNLNFPSESFSQPAIAGVGGTGNTVNLNVGTYIGNKQGLIDLERKLRVIGYSEDKREGSE